MNRQTLGGGWTLRHVAGPLPDGLADDLCGARGISATVPGCVHTDLLTAGLIPDPYVDDNESALAWIGRGTWEYRTTFVDGPDEAERRARERVELVLAGLGTLSDVPMSGVHLAHTENQFRTYRLDLSGVLRPGEKRAGRDPRLGARPRRACGRTRGRALARSFIKDLAVLAERLDQSAVPDAMLLTLFPGEEASIVVATDGELDRAPARDTRCCARPTICFTPARRRDDGRHADLVGHGR